MNLTQFSRAKGFYLYRSTSPVFGQGDWTNILAVSEWLTSLTGLPLCEFNLGND